MFDVVYNNENAIVLPCIFFNVFEHMQIKFKKKLKKHDMPTYITHEDSFTSLTLEHRRFTFARIDISYARFFSTKAQKKYYHMHV